MGEVLFTVLPVKVPVKLYGEDTYYIFPCEIVHEYFVKIVYTDGGDHDFHV